jgi:hypothetical protein
MSAQAQNEKRVMINTALQATSLAFISRSDRSIATSLARCLMYGAELEVKGGFKIPLEAETPKRNGNQSLKH